VVPAGDTALSGSVTTGEQIGSRRAAPAAARTARDSYALFGVSTVLIALYASGFGGPALYAAIIVLGIGGGVIGTRRHQERMTWPWWCLAAAATLWIGSGVIALMTASTGDLSSGRSVLADLFAVPGYVFFGASLHGLARARGVSHDRDTVLDGIMVAAASALLIWETLIQRTLDDEGTWVVAKVLVTSYPILSMCLLVLAARLAFASGPRTTAFNLLLAGTACFLIGDVLFAFGEIGLITLPETVLDIPYLLVPTCFGAALLHPSSSRVGTPVSAHHRRSGRGRLIVVALALLAPLPLMVEHRAGGVPVAPLVIVAILSITGVVRISTAIGDQLRLTRALYHRATHDELTGLVSRSVLLEQADEWLAGGRQVAVLFLDLDRFKYVNDSMGHTAGDELLVGVASRLVGVCPTDAIVSRQSGDEFAVAVPDTGVADALHLAEQIRRTVRVGHRLAAGEAFVAASLGITVSRPGATSSAALLREADTAMYRAKEAGRDTSTVFDASMQAWVDHRVDLERSLHQAVTNDEFSVEYQPIHDVRTGRTVGAEALARWYRPSGPVSPADFIPVAEDSGMIIPIGAYVLDEACRQAAWWRGHLDGGEEMSVSVNVSPRQLRSGDFVDLVAETLRRHELPGHALWLELTERVMMEDSVTTLAVMHGLRSIGVRLAVDDFGTGYSSLSYLKRFPIERVKIDQSFVRGLGESGSDGSLIAAIVAMANALGLELVAEGVETEDQARQLELAGCSMMQGFLFSRPVPPDRFADMMQRLRRPIRSVRCLVGDQAG
jgi:diguanylate cyclase (GGDEF)-like protein